MRVILGIVAIVLLVVLAVGIGSEIYNAGIAAGISQADAGGAATDGERSIPDVAEGIAFALKTVLEILFSLLLIVVILGLARIAFGGWRPGGRPGGVGGHSWGGRRDRIEEWHRELHHRDDAGGGAGSPASA